MKNRGWSTCWWGRWWQGTRTTCILQRICSFLVLKTAWALWDEGRGIGTRLRRRLWTVSCWAWWVQQTSPTDNWSVFKADLVTEAKWDCDIKKLLQDSLTHLKPSAQGVSSCCTRWFDGSLPVQTVYQANQQLHHLRANLIQDYFFNLARIKASEDRELQKEEEAMDGMPTSPFIHKDSISLWVTFVNSIRRDTNCKVWKVMKITWLLTLCIDSTLPQNHWLFRRVYSSLLRIIPMQE